MTKQTEFFIYLLERYARYKQKTAPEILSEWDAHQITDFIFDMYDIYHCERLENAFIDIDSLLETGKPAW